MDSFRRVTTFTTLIASCISILIVCIKPRDCESNPHLQNATIIALSVQLTIFFVLLLHYIGCGCLLKKIGGWIGLLYFILTGLMTWCQFLFLKGDGCMRTAVVYWWWLAMNIGLFYVLIAYGLSLWGAYLCWAQQEEEELINEALQYKYEKMKSQGLMVHEQQR